MPVYMWLSSLPGLEDKLKERWKLKTPSQLAVDFARRHFPQVAKDRILFKTNELDICDGHYVVISPESWDIVADSIVLIEVSEDAHSVKILPIVSTFLSPRMS